MENLYIQWKNMKQNRNFLGYFGAEFYYHILYYMG
jgi:hypothetical protein